MASKSEDHYLAFTTAPVSIGEETYSVRVHWARVAGQVQVVGLDLRAFFSEAETSATARALGDDVHPLSEPWARLSTSVLRGLRFAEVVEESRDTLLEDLRDKGLRAEPQPLPKQVKARAGIRKALVEPDKPRRGPKPALDSEQLRTLVAPAYLDGGPRPIEAVRRALLEVPDFRGHVTTEQARKAVAKARAQGFIPPATRSTR